METWQQETSMVVEGALACKTLHTLAQAHNVELPITDAVRSVVWEGVDPLKMSAALVDRPLTTEFYGVDE